MIRPAEFAGVPEFKDGPCGERARFDYESGCGYRCMTCFAIIGSVGCPCNDLLPPVKKSRK